MFDALQKKKMHVILLSHVGIRTFNDPEREPYDRWEMSTHKKVSAMIREWVDFNLFANYEVSTRTSGQGFKEVNINVLFTVGTKPVDNITKMTL